MNTRYQELKSNRELYVEVTQAVEKYTFATLKDSLIDSSFYMPSQSLGADLISSLSSKLVKSIFPFGQKFFRLSVDENQEEVEPLLIRLEDEITKSANSLNIRGKITEITEHLLMSGNVLLDLTNDTINFYRLDEYVVQRREDGEWYRIMIEKKITVLPEDDTPYKKYVQSDLNSDFDDFSHDFYIDIYKTHKDITITEYINDLEVVETKRKVSLDYPLYPIRLYEEAGANYSHSYCKRQLGDLELYDTLSKVIKKSSLIASKVLHLVNPASIIANNIDRVAKAKNGDFIVGEEGDLFPYTSGDQYNIQFLINILEQIERRLSISYLRGLGVVRERQTTAYEIQTLIAEMSEKFGGFYVTISYSLQAPIFEYLLKTLKIDKDLKNVKVEFLNGVENLRNYDKFQRLSQLVPLEAMYASGEIDFISYESVFREYCSALGIISDDIIKSEEEIQAEEAMRVQEYKMSKESENVR
jgi:hypothetical protein